MILTTTPDRVAALHILESPLLASRTAPYIDGEDIDWTEIYNNVWAVASHSEQVLVDAHSTCSEECPCVGSRPVRP